MRSMIIACVAATLATQAWAASSSYDAAKRIGTAEWAREHCGLAAGAVDISAELAIVVAKADFVLVDNQRAALDQVAKRHGRDLTCRAARAALGVAD